MKKITTLLGAVLPACVLSAQERPNVLLILTDDQGWGDVNINGNDDIETPVMNSLYQEGTVLNHYYSSPLSATTRASLLTGRYHLKTGAYSVQSGMENMSPDETTIAELLSREGYATGMIGKWHNGSYYPFSPIGQGFQEFTGFCCGHWDNYFDPELQEGEVMTTRKGYISDIFADEAMEFISRHQDENFFCYLSFNAPHAPYYVKDEDFDRVYDRLEKYSDNDVYRRYLSSIYGMVENVDYNIGRVLNHLEKLGLDESTIVIFMSDNGPCLYKGNTPRYNGDMKGAKASVHEGGGRVPCYIKWPGKIKHQLIEEPTSVIDILPTLMSFCGKEKFKTNFPVDGISLKDRIMGETGQLPSRHLFTHRYFGNVLGPVMGAVRTDSHRLAVEKQGVSYYDILNDPSQKVNLYDEQNPEHKALYQEYLDWYDVAKEGVPDNVTVPVGYKAAPEVRIAAPEFTLSGRLNVIGFPNCNWVNSFATPEDRMSIEIDVVKKGRYDVDVRFTNLNPDGKASLVVECEGQRFKVALPHFETYVFPKRDRLVTGECYPQTWQKIRLGQFKLPKGKTHISFYVEGGDPDLNLQIKTIYLTSAR